ncbi:MAG: hypothetical protein PHV85_11050 [Desulfovibrionaceae bacterium]|nr:hypothetical protein [Desulfovibrionaceae bacterium]
MSAPSCIGCGWCCLSDQCEVSHQLYGYQKRCPDIYWDQARGRYLCRLFSDPAKGREHREALAAGDGCCGRFNPWRDDVRNRDAD